MLDAYRREYGFCGVYLIPVNLYGPGDNFDPTTSHVIPALIRKFCEAVDHGCDTVECWGSGDASREFLYVDDAAEAIVLATAKLSEPVPVNLGTGREILIRDLAGLIAELCGYHGRIVWDRHRPDGQSRRCLDVSRAADLLNWRAKMPFEDGLRRTIEWWRRQSPPARRPFGALAM
jgi:nucleoside-diphosphate-sugar epimerase